MISIVSNIGKAPASISLTGASCLFSVEKNARSHWGFYTGAISSTVRNLIVNDELIKENYPYRPQVSG